MPKSKPTKKKSDPESSPLKGKTAAELFSSSAQRDILESARKSRETRKGVYKGLFKR